MSDGGRPRELSTVSEYGEGAEYSEGAEYREEDVPFEPHELHLR
jgi:hypothetical protein